MINEYMKVLYEGISEQIKNRPNTQIKKRAEAIGIKDDKIYNWERFLFLICQHVAHHIDLHITEGTKTHSVNFVFAVFLFHSICDFKFPIWSSVKFIKQMEKLYLQHRTEDQLLQVFKPNQNLTLLPFERQFACVCNNKSLVNFIQCEKCLKIFHPSCQYQKLVCNKCYLTHYFFPIDWTFYNRFGQKYHTQTYFHSKFKTFNNSENKKVQLFAMEFDINDFEDLQSAQEPQLWIKIMNFHDQSSNSPHHERWKNLTNKTTEYSMIMNTNRFEFYLNFEPLRRKYLFFRNENSLVFKLENRIVNEKDNILMIVCHPDFAQEENYEIGVFRLTKIFEKHKNNKFEANDLMGRLGPFDERTFRITNEQYQLLEKYSEKNHVQTLLNSPLNKRTNNIKHESSKLKEVQSESEDEVWRYSSCIQLVRSYGCNHLQGFDYKEVKQNYEKLKASNRNIKKKSEKEKSFNERVAQVKHEQRPGPESRGKNFKNKAKQLQTQEKRYSKFIKCPICQNHIMSLYLLPYELKQGEQLRNIHKGMAIKKKTSEVSTKKQLQRTMFEPKKGIFIFQKKEQEDDEQSSPNEPEPSESQYASVMKSCSSVNQSAANDKDSPLGAIQIFYQNSVKQQESASELQDGEMALDSKDEKKIYTEPAQEKIFVKKFQVLSEESSYSCIEEEEVNSQTEDNVEKVSGSGFEPTANTYRSDGEEKEKENLQRNGQPRITQKFKKNYQLEKSQINQRIIIPCISLLSDDEESGEMRF